MSQLVLAGNCRILLKDASGFDCMLVDPPYSPHVHAKATSQSAKGGARHRDLGFDHLSYDLRAFLARCAAQVRKWSVIYSDIEGLHGWREACTEAGASYLRTVPWVRWSMPQLSGDRPPQGCEMLQLFWGRQRGRKSWNGPGNLTHLAHKALRGEGKHKCEKPLDQCLDLVDWFTDPEDKVLDPCAGSGTMGLACRILGRSYFGLEVDVAWAEKANTRIFSKELSERDEERYRRWEESRVAKRTDAEVPGGAG